MECDRYRSRKPSKTERVPVGTNEDEIGGAYRRSADKSSADALDLMGTMETGGMTQAKMMASARKPLEQPRFHSDTNSHQYDLPHVKEVSEHDHMIMEFISIPFMRRKDGNAVDMWKLNARVQLMHRHMRDYLDNEPDTQI